MGYWHTLSFRQVQTRNRCVRCCTKESHCFSCGSVKGKIAFGSENYSKEELVAEIGASMLSAEINIDTAVIDNNVSYINNWLKALRDDKTLIVKAAQKASDYILDIK